MKHYSEALHKRSRLIARVRGADMAADAHNAVRAALALAHNAQAP